MTLCLCVSAFKKFVRLALIFPLLATTAQAQKKEEKPKVHADFYFGSYPASREAAAILKDELTRMVVVSFHEGWSLDKLAKTIKVQQADLAKLTDKLEEAYLAGRRTEYDLRPFMPVVRERDLDRIEENRRRHAQELARHVHAHWKEIDDFVTSLEAAKSVPRERALYEVTISGLLLGALVDAFFEDKTMMPAPPRRSKSGNRFYAWMVESNPAAAGTLLREIQTYGGYRIYSIGSVLPEQTRMKIEDLQGKAAIYEEQDARKWRLFMSVFSRDKMLPFFKSKRDEFLKVGTLVDAGKYSAFAEFFAWYYQLLVAGAADELVAERFIAPPEKLYTYAIKTPQ